MDHTTMVAVKGVVFHGDQMLIIQRSDTDDVGPGTWEIPGGKLEFGETPEAALTRELLEEVGFVPEIESLCYVTNVMTSAARQVIIIAYRCRASQPHVRLSTEHKAHVWADKGDLARYLPESILADFRQNHII